MHLASLTADGRMDFRKTWPRGLKSVVNLDPFWHLPPRDRSIAITAASKSAPVAPCLQKDCDLCPEMVALPAGEFMMGSPESEGGREARRDAAAGRPDKAGCHRKIRRSRSTNSPPLSRKRI